LQLTPHLLAAQVATPFGAAGQTCAHAPQFCVSVSTFWHTPAQSR
jgi:hypothetical protein